MKRLALFSALALAFACAHESAETAPKERFTYDSSAGSYDVTVTPDHLVGPSYEVSRFPEGLRGQVNNRSVDVTAKGNKITGMLGQLPVNLNVTQEGNATRIQGLYGGALSDITVSPQQITGRAGRCSYQLNRGENYYTGFSDCQGGRGAVPTTLHVPEGFTDHPDAQTAASLTVLLGR